MGRVRWGKVGKLSLNPITINMFLQHPLYLLCVQQLGKGQVEKRA